MAEKIPMIALSPTMEEGVIAQWLKKEGETVENGDVICEVETDKATMDYQSVVEGVLLKIVLPEGEGAKVGETIAVIGEKGETVDESMFEAPSPEIPSTESMEEAAAEADSDEESVEPELKPISTPTGKVRATPAARGLAAERGIDLKSINGSGPNGRVIKADVEAAAPGTAVAPLSGPASTTLPAVAAGSDDEIIVVSEKRKVIAQRLSASKFSAPHYYLKLSVEMDEIMGLRSRLNAMRDGKLSFNAFIIKLVAQALKQNLVVNSSWNGDTIIQHNKADIALAVAVDGGLITPVVRDCGAKSIAEIDEELTILIDKAKSGKLQPDEYSNPTFTISNLGSFGIEEFTAIINPPGSAILAVGKTTKTPVVADDEIVVKSLMKLTLSCDHRVIDGAVGAKFMADLKMMLESPSLALA